MIKIKIKNTLFRWDSKVFHLPPTITHTHSVCPLTVELYPVICGM